jgi:hypothetical protein
MSKAKAKTEKITKDKLIAAGSSYVRAAAAAVIAMYMAGITDPKILANAFLAALAGPVLKAIDPKAVEFGIKK